MWGSPRWSGEINVLGPTPYLTDLREGKRVLQKAIFSLLREWSLEQKNLGGHWVREPSNVCGKKMLTVGFWTLVYILSVYSSQKALSLCKVRQNRATDDAEQHNERVAERAESHASFTHLTIWGGSGQSDLITCTRFNLGFMPPSSCEVPTSSSENFPGFLLPCSSRGFVWQVVGSR